MYVDKKDQISLRMYAGLMSTCLSHRNVVDVTLKWHSVVYLSLVVTPIAMLFFCVGSLFCGVNLSFLSSSSIILRRKIEHVALL